MEITDGFPAAREVLEQKVIKLQKSYDKLMSNSKNIRKFVAGLTPNTLTWTRYNGEVSTLGHMKIYVQGPWCRLAVTAGYRGQDINVKSIKFMDQALSSPTEAAKAICIPEGVLRSKYDMDSDIASIFKAMLKHLLEVG